MSEPMARGYIITRTLEFIKGGYFSPSVAQGILDSVPEELRSQYNNLAPATWYPRNYLEPLMRGVAAAKNDEKGSADDLAACGRVLATEATNSFLKILMKMMSPSLFMKKVPDFYQRDHCNSGRFEVDVSAANEGKINVQLVGAEGFDHIGATAVGFFQFGLESISGPNSVDVKLEGWSLTNPSPPVVDFQITLR
jgi:hypothetical protein